MLSNYFCAVIGEHPARTARWHASTIRRAQAFALAIHIPVILWALSGYLSAKTVFHMSDYSAIFVGGACAFLIYLVERVVLATPKGLLVTLLRVSMGLVIAALGSITLDLVIFQKEIDQQLKLQAEQQLKNAHRSARADLLAVLDQKKNDWQTTQNAANCEANGSCGSGLRSVGPVYKELALQAEFLKAEYLTAQNRLYELEQEQGTEIRAFKVSAEPTAQAGLLARVIALHQVVENDVSALFAWCLFFVLLLMFELLVVVCKLLFKETVDDELDRQRELITRRKAIAYVDAITSPVAQARQLLTHEMA